MTEPTFPTAAARQAYHRALGEPYLLKRKPDPVRLKALERVLSSKRKKNVHIRALEEFCTREDIMSLSVPYEVLANEWDVRIGQLKWPGSACTEYRVPVVAYGYPARSPVDPRRMAATTTLSATRSSPAVSTATGRI